MGVAFVMAISTITGVGVESRTVSAQTSYGLSNPTVEMFERDCIQFGSYWQEEYTPEKEIENPVEGEIYTDTDSKSTEMIYQGGKFFKKSPIIWQILKQDGDDLFLLADQVLDCQKYNEKDENVTWESCTLRSWLNDEFYSTAFSSSEQSAIKDSTITNYSSETDLDGTVRVHDGDTNDKIFLLDSGEIIEIEYGFESSSAYADLMRHAKTTAYARQQGCSVDCEKAGSWWLRTAWTLGTGFVTSSGWVVADKTTDGKGVRPALHIDKENNSVSSAVLQKDVDIPIIKSTWDTVEFGTYNGVKITWRVLSVNGDDAFLLADRILLNKKYNDIGKINTTDKYGIEVEYMDYSCTWETCSLRKWLNNSFYKEAFSVSEREAIIEKNLINEENPAYEVDGGNSTSDFVFLPTLSDMVNQSYGFPSSHYCYSMTRNAVPTNSNQTKRWWLRLPGAASFRAVCVSEEDKDRGYIEGGYISDDGIEVNEDMLGVRPALHLNLSHTDVWTKGEVVTSEDKKTAITDSLPDGESTEEPSEEPTKTPTQTQTNTDDGETKDKNDTAPAKVTSLKVTNKKAGKTVVSFKKVGGAAGYQIQYAKNKKFTKGKTSKITKKTTNTIKKLKKKTTYYFRVRAYAKNSSGKKIYGKWSAVKKLKIKK